ASEATLPLRGPRGPRRPGSLTFLQAPTLPHRGTPGGGRRAFFLFPPGAAGGLGPKIPFSLLIGVFDIRRVDDLPVPPLVDLPVDVVFLVVTLLAAEVDQVDPFHACLRRFIVVEAVRVDLPADGPFLDDSGLVGFPGHVLAARAVAVLATVVAQM